MSKWIDMVVETMTDFARKMIVATLKGMAARLGSEL